MFHKANKLRGQHSATIIIIITIIIIVTIIMALKLRDLEWPLIGKYARGPYGLKNFKQNKFFAFL